MAQQTFKTLKLGSITTGPGTAKYPRLNDADTKFKAEGEYSTKLVLPTDSAEAQRLIEIIDAAREKCFEDFKADLTPAKAKSLKRADAPYKDELDKDTGDETGNTEFTFKMKASGNRGDGSTWEQSPDLFDAQNQRMGERIGGGSTIRVNAFISGWNSPTLGAGVSLKLRGVQVLELQGAGGSPEGMGFEATEGGFQSAGVAAAAPAEGPGAGEADTTAGQTQFE